MTGLQLEASAHHDKTQGPCIIPLSSMKLSTVPTATKIRVQVDAC
ncbi:hypothetical protein JI435_403010 [Parastagonospora nodorum SN15]|uniref:Uncharacterized protein n=1 Tax=Phaeosphaeria nodorum (strain SN15 / ATCC MYA-4574 / FGSC 10173) TaxID=321614 RepID=A0A7U2HUY7_PHANO|nr:hypothetical protein JI435_403010 [Parastagonospora nodorum SN15]